MISEFGDEKKNVNHELSLVQSFISTKGTTYDRQFWSSHAEALPVGGRTLVLDISTAAKSR